MDKELVLGRIGRKRMVMEATVRCKECGQTHPEVIKEERPVEVPVIVSDQGESRRERLELEHDEVLGVDDELFVGDIYVVVTAVESNGRRVRRAPAERIETIWANAGVAPCYRGGHVAITLKDEEGGIVAVFVDERFDVATLKIGPPGHAPKQKRDLQFGLPPNMPAGTFGLFVSVGDRIGTPEIALPLKSSDGHRRYRLGTIEILQE